MKSKWNSPSLSVLDITLTTGGTVGFPSEQQIIDSSDEIRNKHLHDWKENWNFYMGANNGKTPLTSPYS